VAKHHPTREPTNDEFSLGANQQKSQPANYSTDSRAKRFRARRKNHHHQGGLRTDAKNLPNDHEQKVSLTVRTPLIGVGGRGWTPEGGDLSFRPVGPYYSGIVGWLRLVLIGS